MNIVLCVGAAWLVVMAIWWALGAWEGANSQSGAYLGSKWPVLRFFRRIVPHSWYYGTPLREFFWYATHGAQWGWEISQDYPQGYTPTSRKDSHD